MSTGISSWANPESITAIYPFVGTEVILVIAATIFWIWWHIKQIRVENRELEEQAAYYRKIGLHEAMGIPSSPQAKELSGVDTDRAASGGVNPIANAPKADKLR